MKTVFDQDTREELINRISALQDNSIARWGKMNVYQMMKHCTKWDDMTLGRIQIKQVFMGKIFGRLALKQVLKENIPLRKNTPSVPELIIKEKAGDLNTQKSEWTKNIREYEHYSRTGFVHPFFGYMTREQVGLFVYKHQDHHLKQFGV